MNFQTLFALGMKRFLPELLSCEGPALDCGASGKYVAPGARGIGWPDWQFPRDPIPAAENSIATLHCYHFLEHLTGADAVLFLREAERVLLPDRRGVMNFSMPYFACSLAATNLDHKSQWCEDTFRNLFDDKTYHQFGEWRLSVHFIMVAGVVSRNLCVIGQLVKAPAIEHEKWYYPRESKK